MRSTRRLLIAAVPLLAAGLLAAPAGAQPPLLDFRLEVLSSPAKWVTGGDALVRVTVPVNVPLHKAVVRVNGEDVTSALELDAGARTLTGLVDGLNVGENELSAEANGRGHGRPGDTLTVTDYPTTGPI